MNTPVDVICLLTDGRRVSLQEASYFLQFRSVMLMAQKLHTSDLSSSATLQQNLTNILLVCLWIRRIDEVEQEIHKGVASLEKYI